MDHNGYENTFYHYIIIIIKFYYDYSNLTEIKLKKNIKKCFIGLLFSEPMFPQFLWLSERNVLDPNEPYITTSQTKIRNVCLSVILELCLLSS